MVIRYAIPHAVSTNKENGWTTAKEINYIKKIGQHMEMGSRLKRITLLRRYLKGCLVREEWGILNPTKIIAFLKTEIKDEK